MTKHKSILLVDDSPFFATTLGRLLSDVSENVTVVHSQAEGLEQLQSRHFHLVVWDIMMLNTASLHVMQLELGIRPLWLLRSTPTEALRWQFMNPEAHAATTIVAKPGSQADMLSLVQRVEVLFQSTPSLSDNSQATSAARRILNRQLTERPTIIGIVASTGGPPVLQKILAMLPEDFSIPIVIVQHISRGFMETFSKWLSDRIKLQVYIGSHRASLTRGIWLAPDDAHMVMQRRRILLDEQGEPVQFAKPSGDVLLESIAEHYGSQALGIVLTGLGQDGAKGLKAIRQAGGRAIVQERSSCTIDGMVRTALKETTVDAELTPEQIGAYLSELHVS